MKLVDKNSGISTGADVVIIDKATIVTIDGTYDPDTMKLVSDNGNIRYIVLGALNDGSYVCKITYLGEE